MPWPRKPDYTLAARPKEVSASRQTHPTRHFMICSRVLPGEISSDTGGPTYVNVEVAVVEKTRLQTSCKGKGGVDESEDTPSTALYAL